MRIRVTLWLLALSPLACVPQQSLEGILASLNKDSVPYITVKELQRDSSHILLDTRDHKEFKVSHMKNAQWVGHKNFNIDSFIKKHPQKNTKIVVYCSIGVRSEDVGEKLQAAGYKNVKNLYGGIFEWKNQGGTVVDLKGKETEKIHAYSRFWAKFLTNGKKVL